MTDMRTSSLPVSVSNLRKRYGEFTAVNDSSFDVEKGEIFGIVGPNGAGKTTTLKMLAGLLEPTSGSVEILGGNPTSPDVRQDIGFLPEESPVYDTMTPRSYLRFFADLYSVPRDTADERIERILDELNLHKRDTQLGEMSKGMRRKVAITRSLINDPDVLIYDEPASGLDPLTTNYIIKFTKSLAEDGKTVIFSAHNLYHIEEICHRIIIMSNGEINAEGTIEDIRSEYGEIKYNIYTDYNYETSIKQEDGTYKVECGTHAEAREVESEIEKHGGTVYDVRTAEESLEDIFLSIAGDQRDTQ